MKGRNEAERKIRQRTALIRVAVLLLFVLSYPGDARSQDLPPAVVALLEQLGENGESNAEELTEQLCALMEHPLNINVATEDELRSLLCLTTFQVASLLEYRQMHGEILSLGELALVDGFNAVTVEALSPLITVSGELPQAEKKKRVWTRIRGRYSYPDYGYLRYKGEWGEHLEWGMTAEQDAGERSFYPDFLSVHLAASNLPLTRRGHFPVVLKRAVAGDYSIRLGQGLTAWNGFSFSAMGVPSSIIRYPSHITPYSSTVEQNFCRGAGFTISLGKRFEFTAFYSNNAVDARCDSVYYYTRPDDGKHISETQVSARHGMRERMAGGALILKSSKFKMGLNGVTYSFDHQDGRKKHPYDILQKYDGWWSNWSLDIMAPVRIGRTYGRLFAEGAVDAAMHPAFLGGGTFSFTHSLECSFLVRHYPQDYIAPHSGAYTTSSGCYNEHGALVNLRWNALRDFTLTGMADLAYHPVERYGIEAGSRTLKIKAEGEWKTNRSNSLSLLCAFYRKNYLENIKYTARLSYTGHFDNGFSTSSRAEVSVLGKAGFLVYEEVGYAAPSGAWNLYLRGSAFQVDEWENRIYCYEKDLYGTFSVPSVYGRGYGVYLFGTVHPLEWLKISLKTSWTSYPDDSERNKFVLKMMLDVKF